MGKYICYEGSEGVGKTTQVAKLVNYLRSKGYSVLETKEPGTAHSPLTMALRKIMLDSQYDNPLDGPQKLIKDLTLVMDEQNYQDHMTPTAQGYIEKSLKEIISENKMTLHAREYISQAIRNIHLKKVVAPALDSYDFIIQDRGILSGLAYGVAGGLTPEFMNPLNNNAVRESRRGENYTQCYDKIILLQGNVAKGLDRALSAKQEFASGDVMEKRGVSFLEKVNSNFINFSKQFSNVYPVAVDGKNIEEVFSEILKVV